MGRYEDLTGQKFNRLTVVEESGRKSGKVMWKCSCECGNTSFVATSDLKNNHIKSCGCLQREMAVVANTVHGYKGERLYGVWKDIKKRCCNPNYKEFICYGGRGISICDEWLNDYASFRNWAYENGYNENAEKHQCTIDRIDVNGNYCPNNCRWVNQKVQNRNQRSNNNITYNGETHCLTEWAEIVGIKRAALSNRINTYGWSIEKALTTPVKSTKNKGDVQYGTGS